MMCKSHRVAFRKKQVFDIILMDPPYNREFEVRTISALEQGNLVGDEGIIVVEHLATDEQDERVGNFRRYDLTQIWKYSQLLQKGMKAL